MNNLANLWNLKRVLAILFLGFVALVVARFSCSFLLSAEDLRRAPPPFAPEVGRPESSLYRISCMTNVAQFGESMERFLKQGNVNLLEVFEKTGKVGSTTSTFDSDRKGFFRMVENHKATVKYEQIRGLCPNRSLKVVLSVSAETFDGVLEELGKVGKLESIVVTKVDRTEDFRALFLKKQSLEKYLEALLKLRQAQGKVDEFIKLEEKIGDIQKEVQGVSLQLGDFTQDESFCNIFFSLLEKKGVPKYSLTQRLLDAIAWSFARYLYLLCAVLVVFLVHQSIGVLRK